MRASLLLAIGGGASFGDAYVRYIFVDESITWLQSLTRRGRPASHAAAGA
jgi:hypothetical protein